MFCVVIINRIQNKTNQSNCFLTHLLYCMVNVSRSSNIVTVMILQTGIIFCNQNTFSMESTCFFSDINYIFSSQKGILQGIILKRGIFANKSPLNSIWRSFQPIHDVILNYCHRHSNFIYLKKIHNFYFKTNFTHDSRECFEGDKENYKQLQNDRQ